MEQSNSYDRIVKLKVRYATTLFLLSLLFIISIFLLNSTIKTNEITTQRLQYLFDDTSNQLAKYRSFKLKNANFYRNLLIAAATKGDYFEMDSAGIVEWRVNDTELWYDIDDGEIYGFKNNSETFDSLFKQSEKFGIQCKKLFSQVNDDNERLIELENVADSLFTNEKFKNYLHKYILKKINNIDDTTNWHQIIQWIVYGTWKSSDGAIGGGGMGISYASRFSSYDSYFEKKYHLYQTLLLTDKDSIDNLLKKEWGKAYLAKENYFFDKPKFSIPSIGFKVGIDDILLVVGPLLFFFQVLFMLYWLKEQQLLLTNCYWIFQ